MPWMDAPSRGTGSVLRTRSLVVLLVTVLTCAMLGPALVLGGLGYDFAYDRIRAETIRSVGRVSETRREQLVTVLTRTTARARTVLEEVERRCGLAPNEYACVRDALDVFIAGERALRAEWRTGPMAETIAVGAPYFAGLDWTPFESGQLARVGPRAPEEARTYAIQVETTAGSRMMVVFPASVLQDIFTNHPDLGRSGETFLADKEGYFVTQARYESTQGHARPIDARPMRTCLSRMSSEVLDLDYRDVDIIHGFRYVPEIGGGCIMAHIDQQEAFAALGDMKGRFALGMLAFAALAVAVAQAIAKRIARPILALTRTTQAIIAGDYNARADISADNEIGQLARSFNLMLERLKFTLRELHDHEAELEQRIRERTFELEDANRKLEALSLTDGLTGLGNRRQFDQTLAAEGRRALRQAQPLALLLLDIDYFKAYNDRYGHPAGDACLREIGQVLARYAQRAGELAARYGGEEFAILLPATGLDEAKVLAESIREAVVGLALRHEASGAGPLVTVSIGVASLAPGDEAEAAQLVPNADRALYQAKLRGRNRVVVDAEFDDLAPVA